MICCNISHRFHIPDFPNNSSLETLCLILLQEGKQIILEVNVFSSPFTHTSKCAVLSIFDPCGSPLPSFLCTLEPIHLIEYLIHMCSDSGYQFTLTEWFCLCNHLAPVPDLLIYLMSSFFGDTMMIGVFFSCLTLPADIKVIHFPEVIRSRIIRSNSRPAHVSPVSPHRFQLQNPESSR